MGPEGADAQPPAGSEIWEAFESYVGSQLIPSDEALDATLATSAEAGLPPISVTANQGRFLSLLVRISGARRVLEVGTLGGYSTIWLARTLPPGGRIISLEVDAVHAEVARGNIARAALEDVVDIRVGPASELLAQLRATGEGPFDLIFIDVDEHNNADLLPSAQELARDGTVIIIGAADLVRGSRRLYAALAQDSGVSAAAVQAVGSAGRRGFVMAVVSDAT